MVAASGPAAALNWRTASGRLPLPRPPSAKVVGVRVVGTQRLSKGSSCNHLRKRGGCRGEPNQETAEVKIACAHRDWCHRMKDSPQDCEGCAFRIRPTTDHTDQTNSRSSLPKRSDSHASASRR